VHAGCGRHLDTDRALARGRVELPADPDDREPAAHQESVADLVERRLIETRQHGLVAAVHDVEQQRAVSLSRVFRL
jgi:hypothetical protein